jgi:inorganic pyrophosphatase
MQASTNAPRAQAWTFLDEGGCACYIQSMNPWHDVEADRIRPENFLAVIEIPKGSKKKYELDKTTGLIRLDRILFTSTHYPQNYGFIPRTLAGDNDPLDVLVLCSETLDPLAMVECYPIGVIKMVDDNEVDEKIIAIPFKDPVYSGYRDISTLPRHILEEISHFFEVYKSLEHSETSVKMSVNRDMAVQIIEESLRVYIETFGPKKAKTSNRSPSRKNTKSGGGSSRKSS